MFGSRTHDHHDHADRGPGVSLARGPAWIVGLALAGIGLAMFFRSPGTPLSTTGFPDGSAIGQSFLGIETNAWTAWGTTAAGILVLMGAAQHALAKTMSLVAGLALGIAALLALVNGDVLGLAAANTWTIVGWAIAAGVLVVTALLPRVGRSHDDERDLVAEGDHARAREQDVAASTSASTREGSPTDGKVAPGAARSTPLQRTYRDRSAEVEAAQRAQAEEAARRR